MPMLFVYLIKLSISLAVVYLFYRLLLQRLTFHNLNRWYLLGYSILSFFIPFINVSQFLDQNKWSTTTLVQLVPAIGDFNQRTKTGSSMAISTWQLWDFIFVIFFIGIMVMLIRFVVQWMSFLRIKRQSQLILDDTINVYEVNKDIIPFSFGRSVFINPQLHNHEEMKEILHHEFVHVRQKHTIDIVWAELLCLFNWYNPFSWLIRHNIRQNLEFIADHKVLENGIEKKEYQYLLLKVLGYPQLHMAASFNFSSLKKRIVMMNKIRSAKVHMVKFLFMLPLLAVLLLAFRIAIKKNDKTSKQLHIKMYGLVVEAKTHRPLSNVHFKETGSQIEGVTDQRGFFSLEIPVNSYPHQTEIVLTREGYKSKKSKFENGGKGKSGDMQSMELVAMSLENADDKTGGSFWSTVPLAAKENGSEVTYGEVVEMLEKTKRSNAVDAIFVKQSAGSQKPYWVVSGHTFLLNAAGGSASVESVTDIVFVDGKRMTGKEVNEKFTRSMINTVGAMDKEAGMIKYGINQAVMEIFVDGLSAKP